MNISVQFDDLTCIPDIAHPFDISIPLIFNGEQPNSYDVAAAASEPVRAGDLIGDTRLGGSCNFEEYRFIPHCTGTHTECIGHVTNDRISVRECLQDVFMQARLISVIPENALKVNETYPVGLDENDFLITKRSLEKVLNEVRTMFPNPTSLIVRTLPNEISKKKRRYSQDAPPFFSSQAIEFISGLGVRHLLVDLPSIDRTFDEGKLSNHRAFWNVDDGSFSVKNSSRCENTITELIFVPDAAADGDYLLNLQITAFETDASPSRPILFKFQTAEARASARAKLKAEARA